METLRHFVSSCPSPQTDVKLARLGGAFAEIGEDDTAFGFRHARYAFVIQARWEDPSETAAQMEWTRRFHAAIATHGNGKVYVNFIGREVKERVRAAYNGTAHRRLREIKKRWDPTNLFRMNANIEPAADDAQASRRTEADRHRQDAGGAASPVDP